MGDVYAMAVANGLDKGLVGVTELDLSHNRIADAALSKAVECVQHGTISGLDCSGNQVRELCVDIWPR